RLASQSLLQQFDRLDGRRVGAVKVRQIETHEVSQVGDRKDPGQAAVPFAPDFLDDAGARLHDLAGQLETTPDLRMIPEVADQDDGDAPQHLFRVAPSYQLVVVHLRQEVVKGEVLRVFLHLTPPADGGRFEYAGRAVDRHDLAVERPGESLCAVVLLR